MYKKRCIARYIQTVYQKKNQPPPPGSLEDFCRFLRIGVPSFCRLSIAYTSHLELEGGLWLALHDSLFILGVLTLGALWLYNPHHTRLILQCQRKAPLQGKTEETNRGYLQGIYGSNTSFQDDNSLLPHLIFHISSPWRTCFLFFC